MRAMILFLLGVVGLTQIARGESAGEAPHVVIETNHGNIVLELYPDKAPRSVENFLAYVDEGYYNGTIFHRVIDGFMIQGGGFTEELAKKPTKNGVPNEADNGLKNSRGTVAFDSCFIPTTLVTTVSVVSVSFPTFVSVVSQMVTCAFRPSGM